MSGIYTIIFVVLFFLFHQKWFHQLVGQVLLAGRYLNTFRSLISMAGSGYNDVNIFLYTRTPRQVDYTKDDVIRIPMYIQYVT